MSMSDDPMTDDQYLIDRLVDGELDPAERRALLLGLETEPGGWRRCALAFLEAQSWREALTPMASGIASGGTPRSSASLATPPSASGPGFARRWRPRAAVAAGWLSAFALGWIASGAASTPRPGPPIVATPGAPSIRPDRSGTASAQPVPPPDPAQSTAKPIPMPGRPPTLVAIPVLDARRLRQAPPPVPEPVRRNLERWGFQVESQHGLVPMRLKDGRRVAIPVDAVKMRYVGNRTL